MIKNDRRLSLETPLSFSGQLQRGSVLREGRRMWCGENDNSKLFMIVDNDCDRLLLMMIIGPALAESVVARLASSRS